MDDLSGLSWSTNSTNQVNDRKAKPMNYPPSNAVYPSLRPTPSPLASQHNTPVSVQSSGGFGSKPQPPKPTKDHFSNLVSFGGSVKSSTASLSLKEQRAKLEAEKQRIEEEKQKQMHAQFGNGQFWDSLSQRPSTINSRTASPAIPLTGAYKTTDDDDADLFAAFKANTKVDSASFYPPPTGSNPTSRTATPALDLTNPRAWDQSPLSGDGDRDGFNQNSDPFGLGPSKRFTQTSALASTTDDDDFLGDLGKPVEEFKKQAGQKISVEPETGKPIEDGNSDSEHDKGVNVGDFDPFKKAVSQLVELGFAPETARRGLTESGVGLNVQAAAGWLLDDAERQARQKAKTKAARTAGADSSETSQRGTPAWMSEGSELPGRGEPDLPKTASAMGASLFKSANSLWKTGQKKMQQAVAELQQEGDPNQPKWMRSIQQDIPERSLKPKASITDEALMLESARVQPDQKPNRSATVDTLRHPPQMASPRQQPPFSPASTASSLASSISRPGSAPKWQQSSQAQSARFDPKTKLSKLAVDDSAPAYISPARRKKMSPQPQPSLQPKHPLDIEPDLFNTTALPSRTKATPQSTKQATFHTSTPQPQAPARQVPQIAPAALQSLYKNRADGTVHFKRGDYAAAHVSYSNSLSKIPQAHPLAILLLTNRALTALRIGEPRQAIEDADKALQTIGPSRGVGEAVSLENGETKEMHELYGKALSRKAEGLEQLEKWAEAGVVWQLCVEGGVGGATAIIGKQRCQKALAPKSKPTPRNSRVSTPQAAVRSNTRPALTDMVQVKDSAAVKRLRAANKAAEAADEEKFALADKVDAKISAWRDGKRDNLRALLGSLDTVLWEGSGWKKAGMHELVMVNRVKIVYMKAIAKCHPDKLPQDANTEVKLIAGTVFATLNESWDKFKAENGI